MHCEVPSLILIELETLERAHGPKTSTGQAVGGSRCVGVCTCVSGYAHSFTILPVLFNIAADTVIKFKRAMVYK